MFDKTKKFIKEHPDAIRATAMVITGAVFGAAAFYCGAKSIERKYRNPDRLMGHLIGFCKDIPNGTMVDVFTGKILPGLTPAELGELGAELLNQGCNELDAYTHFIAIKKA